MDKISKWMKKYADKNGIRSLVIGVSGGIDSAVVSTLCCKTGITTYVVSIPIHQDGDQIERARSHSKWLASNYDNAILLEIDLSDLFDGFISLFNDDFKNDLSLANTRSRLRMVTLYQIAGSKGGIVVGTGNKIEDFGVGFFTKYGDGGVDISPIADLTKTEVRELGKKLGISKIIIDASPTDGLWEDGRSDEDQLGAKYSELEWAMSFKGDMSVLNKREKEVISIYKRFNKANKHKMKKIPVYKNEKS
jgi:NAD+ synthase